MNALYLHETEPGGSGRTTPGPRCHRNGSARGPGRRARTRRNLSDLVLAVSVAVFLCSAVALRVLDSVPLALLGLPLGIGLLWVARAVDPPFAARRPPTAPGAEEEGETQPLPPAAEEERRPAA